MVYTLSEEFGQYLVVEQSENLETITQYFNEYSSSGDKYIVTDENDNLVIR